MANLNYLCSLLIVISLMFSNSSAHDSLQRTMSQGSFASSHEEASKSQSYSSSTMNVGDQMIVPPPLGQQPMIPACPVGQQCVNPAGQQFNHNGHSQKSANFQSYQHSSASQGNSFEIPITCSCCQSKLFISVRSSCSAQGNHFKNFAASNVGGQHRSHSTAYDSSSFSAGGEFHEKSSKHHAANHNGHTHGYDAQHINHNGNISGLATVHHNGQSATFNSTEFNAAKNCVQGNCINAPPLQQLNGMQNSNSNYLAVEAHRSKSSSHHSDHLRETQIGADMANLNMNSNRYSMNEHEARVTSQMDVRTQGTQMANINGMNSNTYNAQSRDMSHMNSNEFNLASLSEAHAAASHQQTLALQDECPNCHSPVSGSGAFAVAQSMAGGGASSLATASATAI